ncbi:MAG: UDP-N-acetylglucosamine 2-epimerase (non-hydrolyzing) [Bacteroidales bacterium]
MGQNKKIAMVVGARPQFIKIALLIHEIKKKASVILIHTGQHYDFEMSESFFQQIKIPEPDYNLEVGSASQGHQTGEMLKRIEDVYIKEKPDLVIVVGDTNSTLAGALGATKLHIKIAHIEAGMRNFDRQKPEEINRIITDHITDYFFASTETAKKFLLNEGIKDNIFLVGDISNDLFQRNIEAAERESSILQELNIKHGSYHVLTIHKSLNTDSKENLEAILSTISEIKDYVVFPMHPRTKKRIEQYGLKKYLEKDHIILSKSLSYFDMIKLMKHSKKIITDSGGIQKEAYTLQIPCITMRKTEWVETVKEGWNCEVDIHNQKEFMDKIHNFHPTAKQTKFLGEGDTFKKIANIIWGKILF